MLWAKIKKGYKLGLKAAKTMKQRKEKRKKKEFVGGYVGNTVKTLPITALVHEGHHGHVW